MKKTVLIAFASLCISTIASAQITKGSILLGGGVGLNRSEQELGGTTSSKSNSFSVSPTIGIAVKENWVVGANAGFYRSKTKPNSSDSKDETHGFSTGLFARRYVSLSNRFYLYGEAGAYYSRSKTEQEGTDLQSNYTTTGGSISVAPGITYAISKRFHLEAYLNNLLSLSYSKSEIEHTSLNNISRSESKNLGFQTNLNTSAPLSIGFRFVLGK